MFFSKVRKILLASYLVIYFVMGCSDSKSDEPMVGYCLNNCSPPYHNDLHLSDWTTLTFILGNKAKISGNGSLIVGESEKTNSFKTSELKCSINKTEVEIMSKTDLFEKSQFNSFDFVLSNLKDFIGKKSIHKYALKCNGPQITVESAEDITLIDLSIELPRKHFDPEQYVSVWIDNDKDITYDEQTNTISINKDDVLIAPFPSIPDNNEDSENKEMFYYIFHNDKLQNPYWDLSTSQLKKAEYTVVVVIKDDEHIDGLFVDNYFKLLVK